MEGGSASPRRLHYPRWRALPFASIKRSDVTSLLDQVEDQHSRIVANAVLATIRTIAFWYASRTDDYSPPIARGMQRGQYVARERVLDDAELRTIWKACDEAGAFGGIVRLALLTAQRKDKLLTMKWDDLKDGTWMIATREAREGQSRRAAPASACPADHRRAAAPCGQPLRVRRAARRPLHALRRRQAPAGGQAARDGALDDPRLASHFEDTHEPRGGGHLRRPCRADFRACAGRHSRRLCAAPLRGRDGQGAGQAGRPDFRGSSIRPSRRRASPSRPRRMWCLCARWPDRLSRDGCPLALGRSWGASWPLAAIPASANAPRRSTGALVGSWSNNLGRFRED